MKRREAMLALGLLVVVLGWFLGGPLLGFVAGDTQGRLQELEALNRRIKDLKKLNEWKGQSLARPDGKSVGRAVEQYQQWVWDVAETVGEFQEVNVSPDRRVAGGRSGQAFVPVRVKLTGQATMENLKTFLFHFYQADLLQRVLSIRLKSATHDGDPVLEVMLIAEALSLPYADENVSNRTTLFPRAQLVASADAATLTLQESGDFPNKDFRVRVGSEFFEVKENKAVKKKDKKEQQTWTWTVTRDEMAESLAPETMIELAKVSESMKGLQLKDYTFKNPFARYIPQLALIGSKRHTLGSSDPVSLTARVKSADPEIKLSYGLLRKPEGMTIDKDSGKISWQPEATRGPGTVPIRVLARLSGRSTPLTLDEEIELRAPAAPRAPKNEQPVLGKLEDVTVVAGLPVEFTVTATDAEKGELSFALERGAPAGAKIEAKTGKFSWIPDSPGDFEVGVEVSDDGSPAQKASAKVTIQVSLDSAQFTVLVASVTKDGQQRAWIYDRLKNNRVILRPKTRLQYGSIDAEVIEIFPRLVVFRVGKTEHRLRIGESLQKLKLVKDPVATPRYED